MENTKISTKNLNLYYGQNHALKDISMEIPKNAITALIGPSGCGKSTFLKTINRMNDLIPNVTINGQILLDGEDVYGPNVDTTLLRKKVGMVFQQPNPFPMSIYDNIAYGPRIHGIKNKAKLDGLVEQSLQRRGHFRRSEGPLKKVRPGPVRRAAAAPVHCPRTGRAAGCAPDGRTNLRARSDFHLQNRGPHGRAEKAVYRRDRYT